MAPLTIQWSNDPTITTALNPNLFPGSYTISVTDAVNCLKTATATISTKDRDGDGYFVGCATFPPNAPLPDCDDNDDPVFPGAPEICDNKDNDCNGQIDEQLVNGLPCPSQIPIPTMSEWGLLIFGLLLINLGVLTLFAFEHTNKE